MPAIEARRTIIVRGALAATDSFTANVNNVPFEADEIRVVNISWYDGTSTDKVYTCYTDLVDNNIPILSIGTRYDTTVDVGGAATTDTTYINGTTFIDAIYPVHKDVTGTWTFTGRNEANVPGTYTANVAIQLEFIKYKSYTRK